MAQIIIMYYDFNDDKKKIEHEFQALTTTKNIIYFINILILKKNI